MVQKTQTRCTLLTLELHRLDHPSMLARHRLLVLFQYSKCQIWQGAGLSLCPVLEVPAGRLHLSDLQVGQKCYWVEMWAGYKSTSPLL